mmetsp:Transcript_19939/g.50282  ORF Transcript_19939/g.50282 Transcript_19939/m.50282 type:complete len:1103 (+) Transcript_19939:205-3513(+)
MLGSEPAMRKACISSGCGLPATPGVNKAFRRLLVASAVAVEVARWSACPSTLSPSLPGDERNDAKNCRARGRTTARRSDHDRCRTAHAGHDPSQSPRSATGFFLFAAATVPDADPPPPERLVDGTLDSAGRIRERIENAATEDGLKSIEENEMADEMADPTDADSREPTVRGSRQLEQERDGGRAASSAAGGRHLEEEPEFDVGHETRHAFEVIGGPMGSADPTTLGAPGFSQGVSMVVQNLAVHRIPAFQEESILSIRDPNYQTSKAYQEYRKTREPIERRARERRVKRLLEVGANGELASEDAESKLNAEAEARATEEEEEETNAAAGAGNFYEEIVFADGSALRFPGRSGKKSLSHAHTDNPYNQRLRRSLRAKNSTMTHDDALDAPRKLLNLEDYSTKHFDRSDPRYHKGAKASQWRRILQVPGGLSSDDNSFTTMAYRHPEQCERKACISTAETNCKEHLPGFYLKERGCSDAVDGGKRICTACQYASQLAEPTICTCEKSPYSTVVQYNEPCDSSRLCQAGECFRPCEFFLHVSSCPLERCMWNTTALNCVDIPASLVYTEWASLVVAAEPTEGARGPLILAGVSESVFPLDFEKFSLMAATYRIQGNPITDLITMVAFFQRFDLNYDGFITAQEFDAQLTKTLVELEAESELKEQQRAVQHLQNLHNARELQIVGNVAAHQQQTLSADSCLQEIPPKFYCSTLVLCVEDCSVCGWKSVGDTEFFICVSPSPTACLDAGKYYCGADEMCHDTCKDCVGRPILDYSQNACLSAWWYTTPSYDTSTWICRHRRKVGRSCVHDQDCIYGLHKCLSAKTTDGTKRQCMPLRPYEETHICKSHFDCPHVNYYCPDDPTGNDPFWIKYCRMQLDEGRKCSSDLECRTDMLCNTIEVPAPRCRRIFSLPLGHLAKDDRLCITGWTNKNRVCTYPAKSKRVGKPCNDNSDCPTTDPTGRTGTCYCKDWWDAAHSKYCLPVVGDLKNRMQTVRDLEQFKADNCGKFYTEEECLEEFSPTMRDLKDKVEGEIQCLSGGPYLPDSSCALGDGGGKYIDYCMRSGGHNEMDTFSAKGLSAEGSASGQAVSSASRVVAIVATMLLMFGM